MCKTPALAGVLLFGLDRLLDIEFNYGRFGAILLSLPSPACILTLCAVSLLTPSFIAECFLPTALHAPLSLSPPCWGRCEFCRAGRTRSPPRLAGGAAISAGIADCPRAESYPSQWATWGARMGAGAGCGRGGAALLPPRGRGTGPERDVVCPPCRACRRLTAAGRGICRSRRAAVFVGGGAGLCLGRGGRRAFFSALNRAAECAGSLDRRLVCGRGGGQCGF